jgi:hypothetical protein
MSASAPSVGAPQESAISGKRRKEGRAGPGLNAGLLHASGPRAGMTSLKRAEGGPTPTARWTAEDRHTTPTSIAHISDS